MLRWAQLLDYAELANNSLLQIERYEVAVQKSEQSRQQESDLIELNEAQRLSLLRLARQSITESVANNHMLVLEEPEPEMLQPAAVFVTLWQTGESYSGEGDVTRLRGCIGSLQADLPLYLAVQKSAISAATRDPRFSPVRPDELDSLTIEIAILSPLQVVLDLEDIVIGHDGLVIEAKGRRGLLLPKVATRLNWDRSEFLRNVCIKAGLPDTTWPDEGQLYRFRTTVFQEPSIE